MEKILIKKIASVLSQSDHSISIGFFIGIKIDYPYSKPSNLGDYHSQSSSRLRSVFLKQPRKASIVEFWGVEGQIVTRLSRAVPDSIMPRAEYYQ
jgi:hypothetical protein